MVKRLGLFFFKHYFKFFGVKVKKKRREGGEDRWQAEEFLFNTFYVSDVKCREKKGLHHKIQCK